jgi:hypothetical protein
MNFKSVSFWSSGLFRQESQDMFDDGDDEIGGPALRVEYVPLSPVASGERDLFAVGSEAAAF